MTDLGEWDLPGVIERQICSQGSLHPANRDYNDRPPVSSNWDKDHSVSPAASKM